MQRHSSAVLTCLLAAFAWNAGCESGGGHASDGPKHAGTMKCSGCGKTMVEGDFAMRCECGATMRWGDLKCKCEKCGHECKGEQCRMKCAGCGKEIDCAKMQAEAGTMKCACGKTITCSDVACTCPKCGGKVSCNTKCPGCKKDMICTDKCMTCAAKK
jgi:hypothetical protein